MWGVVLGSGGESWKRVGSRWILEKLEIRWERCGKGWDFKGVGVLVKDGGRTVEANPNGWVAEVGMGVGKMEVNNLRSALLPQVAPGGDVEDTRTRRLLRGVRCLGQDLSSV